MELYAKCRKCSYEFDAHWDSKDIKNSSFLDPECPACHKADLIILCDECYEMGGIENDRYRLDD